MKLFVFFAGNGIFQDEKINLPLPLSCGYENPTLGLRYVQKLGRASFSGQISTSGGIFLSTTHGSDRFTLSNTNRTTSKTYCR